ncbi:MAG: hypothetical protein A6D92_11180 [Symbiobacterium thermophilum]|uniref:Copper amine oxidase-like N-terminal domain-containing protein n=1 Tax=Symbiobacterium thermophilum TaxID=2734 RepID=A0A1Y2T5D4_SYMTR|nr:MAG: hypothetical protein A6D92_11180 [Symbiobacterium thermophilum]
MMGFVAGFVTAAVLFGGLAVAAGYERQITVHFRPLKYVFDGIERTPQGGEAGFIYQNRTYVPLRFIAESLGRPVEFVDGTIYVGAIPGKTPEVWNRLTEQGEGSFKVQFFADRALSLQGEEMPAATVVTLVAPGSDVEDKRGVTSQLWADYDLPAGVGRMSGTLYVPHQYFGLAGERRVGRLVVLNELNRPIYTSPDLTTKSDPVPFSVPLDGVKRVRIVVTLHPYEGVPLGDQLVMAQMGIAGLKFE